jgi:hypothetical protein
MGGSLMAYGTANVDVVQSSTAGVPPQFNDGNGTQTGTLCRAWVNFNGITTAAIRASFNVSSVTRNGTGDYTVNFTTAMPDVNYSAVMTPCRNTAADTNMQAGVYGQTGFATGSVRLQTRVASSSGLEDPYAVSVSIFR